MRGDISRECKRRKRDLLRTIRKKEEELNEIALLLCYRLYMLYI